MVFKMNLQYFILVVTGSKKMIDIRIISISNAQNYLTMCKQMNSNLFKNKVTHRIFAYKSYWISNLNMLKDLICHKVPPNLTKVYHKLIFKTIKYQNWVRRYQSQNIIIMTW